MFKYKQKVKIISPSFYEGQEGTIIRHIEYVNAYDIMLQDGLMIKERESNIEEIKTPSLA